VTTVFQTSFSPDGQRVLTVTSLGTGLARVHNIQPGKPPLNFQHPRTVLNAVWSPDGKQILSTSAGGEVHFWDANTAKQLAPVNKHGISTSRLAFSANGQQALVADLDGTVRLWEYAPSAPLEPYNLADGRDPWNQFESLDGRFVLTKDAAD